MVDYVERNFFLFFRFGSALGRTKAMGRDNRYDKIRWLAIASSVRSLGHDRNRRAVDDGQASPRFFHQLVCLEPRTGLDWSSTWETKSIIMLWKADCGRPDGLGKRRGIRQKHKRRMSKHFFEEMRWLVEMIQLELSSQLCEWRHTLGARARSLAGWLGWAGLAKKDHWAYQRDFALFEQIAFCFYLRFIYVRARLGFGQE